MERLLHEASSPKPLPSDFEEVKDGILVDGANAGRDLVIQSPVFNIPLPSIVRSETLYTFTSQGKSFRRGCLHLHQVCVRSIASIERWIQLCKKKRPPTTGLSSLSNPINRKKLTNEDSATSSSFLNNSNKHLSDLHAELNDLAARRKIARRDLASLKVVLIALEMERSMHSPISTLIVANKRVERMKQDDESKKKSRWESVNTEGITEPQSLLGAAVASAVASAVAASGSLLL